MEGGQARSSNSRQDEGHGPNGFRDGHRGSALRIFLDTSAVIKLFIDEEYSDDVRQLLSAENTVEFVSSITYVEVLAALARIVSLERISRGDFEIAKDQFQTFWATSIVVELTGDIREHAGDLAIRHTLRGYDAVQLASALTFGRQKPFFVCWDHDLTRAAKAEGLDTF